MNLHAYSSYVRMPPESSSFTKISIFRCDFPQHCVGSSMLMQNVLNLRWFPFLHVLAYEHTTPAHTHLHHYWTAFSYLLVLYGETISIYQTRQVISREFSTLFPPTENNIANHSMAGCFYSKCMDFFWHFLRVSNKTLTNNRHWLGIWIGSILNFEPAVPSSLMIIWLGIYRWMC